MEKEEREAIATEEKNALFFLAVFTALLERRATPRLVNMVSDENDGDAGCGKKYRANKLRTTTYFQVPPLDPESARHCRTSQGPNPNDLSSPNDTYFLFIVYSLRCYSSGL